MRHLGEPIYSIVYLLIGLFAVGAYFGCKIYKKIEKKRKERDEQLFQEIKNSKNKKEV